MAESNSRWPAWKRVPPFLPVPLRPREPALSACPAGSRRGWTPERQARFIGVLAESGSVAAAARAVGMSRMAAYRLRRHSGAESLAHAWDSIIALHTGEPVPQRKVTASELAERAYHGEFHILMRRRRFVRAVRKPSNTALLRLLRRLDAAAARAAGGAHDRCFRENHFTPGLASRSAGSQVLDARRYAAILHSDGQDWERDHV